MVSFKELLTLEPAGDHRFTNVANQVNRRGFLFGGQLLAQSLCAAAATVEVKRPHSMQVSFEKAVTAGEPVVYEIRDFRDGASLSTRRVYAYQATEIVLIATVSFAAADLGFEHQSIWYAAPPPPDSLMTLSDVAAQYETLVSEHGKGRLTAFPQVEIKPIDVEQHLLMRAGPARSRFWIRAAGELPRDPAERPAILAYLSDYLLINAALIPHVADIPDEHLFVASLNHSMWFHSEADPSQWLLFEVESPWAGRGRTLCCGRLFAQDGLLVASVAQEAMVRRRQR